MVAPHCGDLVALGVQLACKRAADGSAGAGDENGLSLCSEGAPSNPPAKMNRPMSP